jgi:phosphoribosylformylglycinamidine (FGAM) synthase-like enzyme
MSDGGIAAALAEMVAHSGVGMTVPGIISHTELFGEAPSRVVACVAADHVAGVLRRAVEAAVPVTELGDAGGDRLRIGDRVDLPVEDVVRAWKGALPAALGTA